MLLLVLELGGASHRECSKPSAKPMHYHYHMSGSGTWPYNEIEILSGQVLLAFSNFVGICTRPLAKFYGKSVRIATRLRLPLPGTL
jgi:hypothetical protein